MRNLAGAIALLLTAAGLLRADGDFLAAALPFAAYALMAAFLPAPAPRLRAERSLSAGLVPAGAHVQVTVTVANRGPRLDALHLSDPLPEGVQCVAGETQWRGSLDAGAQAILRYTIACPRGSYRFESLEVVAEDPFTGAAAREVLPCPGRLDAHPRPRFAGAGRFATGTPRPFSGLSRTQRIGAGVDFAGLRPYAPGDPLRRLNWRAEAYWGRTLVNLYEEPRAIDVGIILDCRAKAYGEAARFETAVAAALSWAEGLMAQGHRVAFLLYGGLLAWTPPGTGREQRTRLRMTAAQARLGAHMAFEGFDNLPLRIFPARSLILLVSPLRRGDAPPLRTLRALGYEVAVLDPDPRPEETLQAGPAEALAQRIEALEGDALASHLLRAGVVLLDGNPVRPPTPCRPHPEAP